VSWEISSKYLPISFFFLDELDVGQAFGGEFDRLVEAVFSAVTDVDELQDLALEPPVEHVGLGELGLEVGRAGENETGDVGLVVGDEELGGDFRHFPHVIVAFFHAETGET